MICVCPCKTNNLLFTRSRYIYSVGYSRAGWVGGSESVQDVKLDMKPCMHETGEWSPISDANSPLSGLMSRPAQDRNREEQRGPRPKSQLHCRKFVRCTNSKYCVLKVL